MDIIHDVKMQRFKEILNTGLLMKRCILTSWKSEVVHEHHLVAMEVHQSSRGGGKLFVNKYPIVIWNLYSQRGCIWRNSGHSKSILQSDVYFSQNKPPFQDPLLDYMGDFIWVDIIKRKDFNCHGNLNQINCSNTRPLQCLSILNNVKQCLTPPTPYSCHSPRYSTSVEVEGVKLSIRRDKKILLFYVTFQKFFGSVGRKKKFCTKFFLHAIFPT